MSDIGNAPRSFETEQQNWLNRLAGLMEEVRTTALTTTVGGGTPVPGPPGQPGQPGPPGEPAEYIPDLTPPPAPSGVSVTAGLVSIFITHDPAVFTQGHGYERTIVYGAKYTGGPLPTFSNAAVVHEFIGGVGSFPTETGTQWHIWLKWKSVDGVESSIPAGGTNGFQATTGKIGNSDLNDLIITAQKLADGSISASKLAAQAIEFTKFANGIEPVGVVSALPNPAGYTGPKVVVLTTDGKLYRLVAGAWTSAVPAADVSGTLVAAQIANAAITTAKFAAGIEPVTLVTAGPLPTVKSTTFIFWTDNKLYRWNGTAYVSTVPATDITGQVQAAQVAALEASKITGQLTDAQLQAISAAKVAGQLTDAQLQAISAAKVSGQLTDAQIQAIAAAKVSGQLTDAQIQSIAAAKVSGQLVSGQIADAAITTAKFAAGIEPVRIVTSVPVTNVGSVVLNSTDGKVYRWNGTAYTSAIPSADILGQLTNAQLQAIDAAKVTGQIIASQIGAGAVTASKLGLQIGGGNMLPNSSFEADSNADGYADNWVALTPNQPPVSLSTDTPFGGFSQRIIADGASPVPRISLATKRPKVFSGQSYVLSVWAKAPAGSVIFMAIGDAAAESTGGETGVRITAPVTTATGSWQRAVFVFTSNNSNFALIQLGFSATAGLTAPVAGVECLFDRVQLEAGDVVTAWAPKPDEILPLTITATEITDNAITTPKLAAGSVVAGKIAAAAVSANELAAGAVTAGKIAAGAIVANDIAAATITGAKIAADTITAANLAANSVTANELAANAVIAGKIQAGAISAAELAAGAVTTAKLAAGAVTANEIAAGTITGANVAAATLTAANLAAGSVTAGQIAAGAVTTPKLAAGAVTANELAAASVIAGKLAADSVTATALAAGSVTTTKIAAGSVTAGEIAAGAVTTPKIAAGAVTANELAAASVVAGKIATDAITAANIQAGAVTTAKLAAGSVTAGQIAASTITGAQIAADTITAANLAANSVTANELQGGSVIAGKIAAGAVSTTELSAGAVTTAKLAAGAVTANEIAANTITGAKVAAATLTAANLAAGTITANELAANSVTAGKVAAGAISTAQLVSGAITTDKLLVTGQGGTLTPDPMATDASAWVRRSGSPSFVFVTGITDLPVGSTAVQNEPNVQSGPGTVLIPIDGTKNYRLEMWVKQEAGAGTAYLFAAWFDANKNVLISSTAQPAGAGIPAGWSNGSYSYFGLVNQAVPTVWTKYGISFGPDETAKIPSNARFISVGALLNFGAAAGAVHRLSNVRLWEKASADLIVDGSIVASKIAVGAIAAGSAAIANGAISNAMLGNAIIDDAKVGNLSAAKLTAGDGTIGNTLKSETFTPGSGTTPGTGWQLERNGTIRMSNAVVYGTVVASAGAIGGIVINSTGVQSTNYTTGPTGAGWRLENSGTVVLPATAIRGKLTTDQLEVGAVSTAVGLRGVVNTTTIDSSGGAAVNLGNAANPVSMTITRKPGRLRVSAKARVRCFVPSGSSAHDFTATVFIEQAKEDVFPAVYQQFQVGFGERPAKSAFCIIDVVNAVEISLSEHPVGETRRYYVYLNYFTRDITGADSPRSGSVVGTNQIETTIDMLFDENYV